MTGVTWFIQNNMGSSSDIQDYIDGVKASGATVHCLTHIPFTEHLSIDWVRGQGAVVFYGSTSFIKAAQKLNVGGVFFDDNTFTYDSWTKHYGSLLLNCEDHAHRMTIGQVKDHAGEGEEDIFVRPQSDNKSFAGHVSTLGEFKKWCKTVSEGGYYDLDSNTPIIIARAYGIEAEWRFFIVDSKIISASQYKKNDKLYKALGAPKEAVDFANMVISLYEPSRVYVLDICRSAGNYFIVEAQGFNSAGHYLCDMKKVASSVNAVALDLYLKEKEASAMSYKGPGIG